MLRFRKTLAAAGLTLGLLGGAAVAAPASAELAPIHHAIPRVGMALEAPVHHYYLHMLRPIHHSITYKHTTKGPF